MSTQSRLSISELQAASLVRITGVNPPDLRPLVWVDRGAEVVVHPSSLQLTCADGWLEASIDLEADGVGRARLVSVFYFGGEGQGHNTRAAVRSEVGHRALGCWAPAFEAAVWDGVLDRVEAALGAGTLTAFHGVADGLIVEGG